MKGTATNRRILFTPDSFELLTTTDWSNGLFAADFTTEFIMGMGLNQNREPLALFIVHKLTSRTIHSQQS
ncbi:unnamed protein product [Oppiella nova]|uniref:Uncharacterized protein n=1 Tax=Oppiella nova TaxID=334625 RepID=A0A7R9M5J1_9ACAR|nr:unnamed protein product [Oppiella nova]CAG2170894.1 unnamed protein product [Oppiella nova]